MNDLRTVEKSSEFATHLLSCIEQFLERGKSKLDPKEFRTLYIKKISQDQNKKHNRHTSMGMNNSKKLTVLNLGS
jgi:hypothetical protein